MAALMKTTESSSLIRSGTHVHSTEDLDFRYAGATDIGERRTVNQDRFLLVPLQQLFLVADGMGGHAAGEVAARMAVDMIAAYYQETGAQDSSRRLAPQNRLAHAVRLANSSIFQESADDASKQGMGTTIVALHFDGAKAFWAHVGDSRLYRIRHGGIMQLTEDHSLLNETLARQDLKGQALIDFVDNFPYKNVLTRALGVRYHVEVDYGHTQAEDGDVYLITTDGAHNQVSDEEMRDIVLRHCQPGADPQSAADEIIRLANERGGPDNITVAIIETRRR
jgi:PPM family protein phosphatase